MSSNSFYLVSRRDFGFVIAKILALVAFKVAMSYLATLVEVFRNLQNLGTTRWGDLISSYAPYTACGLVAAFIGVRLWVGAEDFGAGADDEANSSAVGLSRNVLLQGLAIGAAIWMLAPVVPFLAAFLANLLGPQQKDAHFSLPPNTGSTLIINIAFGIGLLVWAARLAQIAAPVKEEFEGE